MRLQSWGKVLMLFFFDSTKPSTNPFCYPVIRPPPATSSLPSQHESWCRPKAALQFLMQASGGGGKGGGKGGALPLPQRACHSFHLVTTTEVLKQCSKLPTSKSWTRWPHR